MSLAPPPSLLLTGKCGENLCDVIGLAVTLPGNGILVAPSTRTRKLATATISSCSLLRKAADEGFNENNPDGVAF
jgi:hypothetical protein